jgi:hypothetical protein
MEKKIDIQHVEQALESFRAEERVVQRTFKAQYISHVRCSTGAFLLSFVHRLVAHSGWLMHRTVKYKTINHPPIMRLLPAHFPARGLAFVQKWLNVVPIGFGKSVVFQTMLSMSPYARVLIVGPVADTFVWDSCVAGTLVWCVVVRLGVEVGADEKLACGFTDSQMAFETAF